MAVDDADPEVIYAAARDFHVACVYAIAPIAAAVDRCDRDVVHLTVVEGLCKEPSDIRRLVIEYGKAGAPIFRGAGQGRAAAREGEG